jgi:hypothetical protein
MLSKIACCRARSSSELNTVGRNLLPRGAASFCYAIAATASTSSHSEVLRRLQAEFVDGKFDFGGTDRVVPFPQWPSPPCD